MRCTIVIEKIKLDEISKFIQYIDDKCDDWRTAEISSIEIE